MSNNDGPFLNQLFYVPSIVQKSNLVGPGRNEFKYIRRKHKTSKLSRLVPVNKMKCWPRVDVDGSGATDSDLIARVEAGIPNNERG